MDTISLNLDTSEISDAIQQLKVAADAFMDSKARMRTSTNETLAEQSVDMLIANNPALGDIFAAVVGLVTAMGGQIAERGEGRAGSVLKDLNLCGEVKHVPLEHDLLCGFPQGHEGPHSWD